MGYTMKFVSSMLILFSCTTSLKLAVGIHMDKAYMLELQRTLYSFVSREYAGDAIARGLLAELTLLMAQEMPNSTMVDALGNRITEFVVAPEWFTKYTELCFDWYPDGDAGQCSGPSRRLCAQVDKMTPYYRDDSDRRPGGCQMSWGLYSSRSPAWFKQASVCFKWSADGDRGQCGDHSEQGEVCSPLGGNTPFYRDDTDGRAGGCVMLFRFKIPDSAPGWALNSQLCFFSYADGDRGQCGGAGNHCVVANQWTPYYRDDTDRRPGGCQMSWGLKAFHS